MAEIRRSYREYRIQLFCSVEKITRSFITEGAHQDDLSSCDDEAFSTFWPAPVAESARDSLYLYFS